jgi:hypothetical protein
MTCLPVKWSYSWHSIVDLGHGQLARTSREVDVVSQPELMVKSLRFIGHFGPLREPYAMNAADETAPQNLGLIKH